MAWWSSRVSLSVAMLVATASVQLAGAGNTTCASKQLDWYTSVVGVSPCMTYQRLRQICNNDYQVPTFPKGIVPGDQCQDQISACCCNPIAFQLSMLCLNCQHDTRDSGGSGFDAGSGAFDVYKGSCSPAENKTFPNDIQRAVCNENIRIDNFLYGGGWPNGAWFYVWTKENAEREHAANNNNTFTHCPNQISPSTAPTSTKKAGDTGATTATTSRRISSPISATSPTASTRTSGTNLRSSGQPASTSHEALIGGAVGAFVGLSAIVLAVILWMRRRASSRGSQWTQNPRFAYMYSETPVSGDAPKSSLAPSRFGTAGPLSSRFSYSDFSGTRMTDRGTWNNPHSASQPTEPSLRHDDDPVQGLSRSNSGLLSDPHNTSQDTDRGTGRPRPRSGAAPSVSLSAFDFSGSQFHDDGRTMRSFPLSAIADEFAFHEYPQNGTRAPTNGRMAGALESRSNPHGS